MGEVSTAPCYASQPKRLFHVVGQGGLGLWGPRVALGFGGTAWVLSEESLAMEPRACRAPLVPNGFQAIATTPAYVPEPKSAGWRD